MFWKKWLSDKQDESPVTTEIPVNRTSAADSQTSEIQADLRAVVVSDLGCVRTNNEDSARFIRPSSRQIRNNKGFLAIVADGMGGHAAGEVASQMAVETIAKTYFERDETSEESLFLAFTKANRSIWQSATRNAHQKGMGTTCTALAIVDTKLFLAHVGDSRAYLLKKGQIFQLSKDHTYVQNLVDQGVITPSEAEKHPERNVLTRAMGTHGKVEIDVTALPHSFEDDDRLLICSDGLYDYLTNDEIAQLMLFPVLNEAAYQLIDLAKQRGGHDNITVLLAERVSPETFESLRPTEHAVAGVVTGD
ncbi:Stp1/IreP family PP2C-type Ser/Thr phosphatase [Dyadobacter sp. CY323]|uniref:Stp1/IreP family PP2C-type Ser/Thr phosphatase n=1 Tax=Dyadobacter sp. CY323 TaxID=2907302 RepID=UPI001F385FAB|nr:Stp1/IreP family PP2C-type Ser/Thr phosphatase [Dyadobacter sp. CY323]MCE6991373.1 Stp1/IreP family PP2C-type Ser/Thr phosphatase [Dyadobacter sp. CY323]